MRSRLVVPLTAAALAWPFVEPHLPVLRQLTLPVLAPGDAPLRVLHLSDLHLLPRHRRRASWVRDLAAHRPDLVVSTGDHLSSVEAIGLLATTLGALTADGTPGVFVPGNNDWYTPLRPRLRDYVGEQQPRRRRPDLPWGRAAAALVEAGWTDLRQQRTTLTVAGRPVALTGTDDGHLRRDRYAEVAGPVSGGGGGQTPGAGAPATSGPLGIGVTHTPALRLLDAFAADGHALVLAGHTHGGQLRLPVLGPATTNCDLQRSRARGLSPLLGPGQPGWLHVSAGLGSSPYLPVRLCCRPEATLLELVAAPAGRG